MPNIALILPADGEVNGSNTIFLTSVNYVPGSPVVFVDGVALIREDDDGWDEMGQNKLRLKIAPLEGSTILVYFRPAF